MKKPKITIEHEPEYDTWAVRDTSSDLRYATIVREPTGVKGEAYYCIMTHKDDSIMADFHSMHDNMQSALVEVTEMARHRQHTVQELEVCLKCVEQAKADYEKTQEEKIPKKRVAKRKKP